MNKEMKAEHLSENHQLAMDTLDLKPTKGIGSADIHMMDHQHIERLAGVEPGAYKESGRSLSGHAACGRHLFY